MQSYKSENDRVYINYLVYANYFDNPNWESYDPTGGNGTDFKITAVYCLRDDALLFEGFMSGWISDDVSINNGEITMQY